jgi:hypothetical protein
MPEEQPPAGPRQTGSDWSWSHPDEADGADRVLDADQSARNEPAPAAGEHGGTAQAEDGHAANPADPEPGEAAHAGARRGRPLGEDFRRTVGFTVLGTIIPGVGLIAAGRKVVGSVVLAVFVLVLAAIGIAAAVDRDALIQVGVDPTSLRRLAVVLVVVAAATGGSLVRALVIGAFFFVAATAWSWRRWRERLRDEERRRT